MKKTVYKSKDDNKINGLSLEDWEFLTGKTQNAKK